MALTIIDTPPLGAVAQGVAGLWAIEAQGFSPDSSLLLVKAVYSDSAFPSVPTRTAFWIYDVALGQYGACINDLIADDRPIEVTDVSIGNYGGQIQLVATYRDTGASSGLDLNKLALIRGGVLLQSDLIAQISGNQADALISSVKATADGRFVVVETAASNLATELDTNGSKDIYVLDLELNSSRRVTTINSAEPGVDSVLGDVMLGSDGALSVAFQSTEAFTTQDANASDDVFLWHLPKALFASAGAGTMVLASRTSAGATGGTNPLLNLKGVLFESESGSFSSADLNNAIDVWQSNGASVVPVSVSSAGTPALQTKLGSSSDSGRYVAVVTASPEIAGPDGVDQLVIVETVAGSYETITKSAIGALADDAVISPVMSPNGIRVAFSSQASNLGTAPADGLMHLYIAELEDAPTGSVTITGTATQGQTLTAANTLADADGLGTIGYQWKADGSAISGASSTTYVLTEADVGKVITVTASYIDGYEITESVTSSATGTVGNVNDAPTGAINITGTAMQGQTLTAANTLADADGLGTIGYQWQWSVDGSTDWISIDGATASTLLLTADYFDRYLRAVGSYTDTHGTAESVASNKVQMTATISFHAYSWKAHTLLEGVSITAGTTPATKTTDASGSVSFSGISGTTLSLTAARAIPSGEVTLTNQAVSLQDAIAILKMIVGLEVNGAGKALSPYQSLAADFDGNGTVSLTDAIGVLKHVVGLSSPAPQWLFFNEADAAVPGKANLNPGAAPTTITADLTTATAQKALGLVGVLRGDVDGSFGGASGAQDLDASQLGYFDALATAHDLNLSQFGIYS